MNIATMTLGNASNIRTRGLAFGVPAGAFLGGAGVGMVLGAADGIGWPEGTGNSLHR